LLYARESLDRTSYKELNWEKEVEEEEKEETPQVPTKKKKTNRKTKSQVATLERIRSRLDTIDFGKFRFYPNKIIFNFH
jgi:division protein CdvB (Snf7/Vps24/ESCRT-III family)